MATKKLTTVRGKRFRVTKLDECGRVTSQSTFVVDDGFVSVSISAETEDGAEVLSKKFTGEMCVNERGNDTLKYLTLEAEFCGVHPDVLESLANVKPYQDYKGDTAGFTVAEGTLANTFALEIWTGLTGQACGANENEVASGYFLLPFVVGGALSGVEWSNEDPVTFSMEGARTKGGNSWATGPYKVMHNSGTPAKLPEALDPLDHLLVVETTVRPPEFTTAPTLVSTLG